MEYLTAAELATRYGQDRLIDITDHDGDGLANDPMIAQAIADASAEIDGYLATRYQLPLPTVPAMIARIASDIAIYRLLSLRRMGDIEDARRRYEDARRLLEAISRGTVALGLPASLPPDQKPGLSLAAAKSGPAPVFGPDQMGSY
ncbi:MAG: gp436 family protein [Pseudomonadota bacterium]